MLKVQKDEIDGVPILRLSGTLDETDDLEKLLNLSESSPQDLFCSGVSRLNSAAAKAWIRYFQDLSDRGIKVRFHELSSILVEQLNTIRNFTGPKSRVVSVVAHYLCDRCQQNTTGILETAKLVADEFKLNPGPCPECGGHLIFDDTIDDYFAFLKRD